MTRLFGAILVLTLVSGCSAYFQQNDEVAFSGQGVLASYDQSKGELADSNRVNTLLNKRRMKPVDLGSDRIKNQRVPVVDSNGRTVQTVKRRGRSSTGILIRSK